MELSPLFTDHAVLQQGKNLPVWGWCRPFQTVSVELNGASVFTTSDNRGAFLVRLPAMAAGGPYELKVATLDGQEWCTVQDVMIGEVWIAGGQSNMSYPFGNPYSIYEKEHLNSDPDCRTKEYHQFLKENTAPKRLRYIRVPTIATGRREPSFKGCWRYSTDPESNELTAVGGWFALSVLKRHPEMTIGLIDNSWGGTIAEAWTSEATCRQNLDLQKEFRRVDQYRANRALWEELSPAVPEMPLNKDSLLELKCDTGIIDKARGWAEADFDDSAWKAIRLPLSWIATKLSTNGVVWIRQSITLPEGADFTGWTIHLGAIDKQDTTFINGIQVGHSGENYETGYWNLARCYAIGGNVLHAGRNVIAVRASSFIYDGSFQGVYEDYYLEDAQHRRYQLEPDWRFAVEQAWGIVIPPPGSDRPYGPGNQNTPAILFDSMLWPLIPYALRGVIWYQGESNGGSTEGAKSYERKLQDMIRDWRKYLENGDMPFIQVELPCFRKADAGNFDDCWPGVRYAQQQAAKMLPAVGCVPTMELGEAEDIHPRRKREVGERLAAWALKNVYHHPEVVCDGPRCTAVIRDAVTGQARLQFQSDGALELRRSESPAFFTCDGEKKITQVVAAPRLEGDEIILDIPADARWVGYGWSDNPPTVIFNDAGFPAHPFLMPLSES